MPEIVINLCEAKTRLSMLVERAAAGQEVVIAKTGKPMAMLVPFRGPPMPRAPGAWKGLMRIASSFEDPLPEDLKAEFGMSPHGN